MDNKLNFEYITPCGENCNNCNHKQNGECKGCRETDGKCIKMWTNGCDFFKCCKDHNAYFCGLCEEFPCNWIIPKITSWNPEGISNIERLKREYKKIT